MPSRKHLPEDVVANKFRQRGWEVNSSAKDFCPSCIAKRHGPKKNRPEPTSKVIPLRDITALTAGNISRAMAANGFTPAEVVELEDRDHRRFRIAFKNPTEFQLCQIKHAETEIVQSFQAALRGSYLKIDFSHSFANGKFVVEPLLYWYLSLDVRDHIAAAR
jgi:hypothetical protein